MKRIMGMLAALALSFSPVAAQDDDTAFFFQQGSGEWVIVGHPGVKEQKINPSCVLGKELGKDARILFVTDLVDGELYISFHSPILQVNAAPGRYQLRVNFYGRDQMLGGTFMDYVLMDDQTVIIPKIPPEKFIPLFIQTSLLQIVMPGKGGTLDIDTRGSFLATSVWHDCLKSVENGTAIQQQKKGDGI